MISYSNENPKHTRMSAATWINEATTSLFLTGCNDGSVRIWDGILEPNDEISREKPTLVSSFFAAPDISVEKGSTGLILEYQGYFGRLIAGGSTKQVRCWDLEAEKCSNYFDTCSDYMITTLESMWKHSYDGYFGLSADIVVAGFSNGALKLFDVRMKNGVPALNITEKRRVKQSEFDEHNSWIVDVSFTGFAGRQHEVSRIVLRYIKSTDHCVLILYAVSSSFLATYLVT
jgi:regulator-associated protein of mTOR